MFDPDSDDYCLFCNNGKGDVLHVLMYCTKLEKEREKFLPAYFAKYPSDEKFIGLFKLGMPHIIKLCKFIDCIDNMLKTQASLS